MRLLGGIFNDRLPRNQHRGNDDINGRSHRDHIQIHPATLKPLFSGAGVYIGIGFLHLCAQSQEALHMLINGAGCKITATGQSHPRPPKAAKLSPDEVIRRPNAPYQSWVRLHIAHIGTVNFHRIMGPLANGSAHLL